MNIAISTSEYSSLTCDVPVWVCKGYVDTYRHRQNWAFHNNKFARLHTYE